MEESTEIIVFHLSDGKKIQFEITSDEVKILVEFLSLEKEREKEEISFSTTAFQNCIMTLFLLKEANIEEGKKSLKIKTHEKSFNVSISWGKMGEIEMVKEITISWDEFLEVCEELNILQSPAVYRRGPRFVKVAS